MSASRRTAIVLAVIAVGLIALGIVGFLLLRSPRPVTPSFGLTMLVVAVLPGLAFSLLVDVIVLVIKPRALTKAERGFLIALGSTVALSCVTGGIAATGYLGGGNGLVVFELVSIGVWFLLIAVALATTLAIIVATVLEPRRAAPVAAGSIG